MINMCKVLNSIARSEPGFQITNKSGPYKAIVEFYSSHLLITDGHMKLLVSLNSEIRRHCVGEDSIRQC